MEGEEQVTVQLRSKNSDVSEIAKKFGLPMNSGVHGGGHKNAAAFVTKKALSTITEDLKKEPSLK